MLYGMVNVMNFLEHISGMASQITLSNSKNNSYNSLHRIRFVATLLLYHHFRWFVCCDVIFFDRTYSIYIYQFVSCSTYTHTHTNIPSYGEKLKASLKAVCLIDSFGSMSNLIRTLPFFCLLLALPFFRFHQRTGLTKEIMRRMRS